MTPRERVMMIQAMLDRLHMDILNPQSPPSDYLVVQPQFEAIHAEVAALLKGMDAQRSTS